MVLVCVLKAQFLKSFFFLALERFIVLLPCVDFVVVWENQSGDVADEF